MLEVPLEGESKPFLCARFQFEAHAGGIAHGAQQANRLIRETVYRKRAHLATLDIGKAVGGIEQQTARGRIQRDGDGVQRKVPPAQILHDRRPADFGARARPDVIIVARGGDAAVAISGEDDLNVPRLFVLENDLTGDLRGIALNREIEVAEGRAGDQVAHRAAGQIDVEAQGRGQLLDTEHGGALFRREPAFEQEHVVGHCAPHVTALQLSQPVAGPSRFPGCRAMRAGDALCKSASSALRPRGYRSASSKCPRGPA